MNWIQIDATQNRAGCDLYGKEIEKPMNDDREYRLIRLENGLQALLIHDSASPISGACMNVAVGQLSDLDDLPGLAHFCEHMLFLGTEQYPNEGEYTSYLSMNGGSAHATTSPWCTSYHFSVRFSALHGALSRFSAMFHSPLFSPSATLRELLAVDSEDNTSRQRDWNRILQVIKSLISPTHPWSRFGNGNSQSLTGSRNHNSEISSMGGGIGLVDEAIIRSDEDEGGEAGRETRRRLVQWWREQYCAGRMKLVILGRENVVELADVAATLFSPIKNRGVEAYKIYPSPYEDSERGTVIFVKSLNNMFSLELIFPIPRQAPHFQVKPAQFIGNIVKNSSVGGLESYLKDKKWASRLWISSYTPAEGLDTFAVRVELTPEGLSKYQDVAAVICSFIHVLRISPLPEHIYNELKQLSNLAFRFQHKNDNVESIVSDLAERLQSPYCPGELLLRSPYFGEWNETPVRELLDALNPQHVLVLVAATHLDGIAPPGEWNQERWYKTEYKVTKMDEAFFELLVHCPVVPEIGLPEPNPYVPTNTNVEKQNIVEPLVEPNLLRETPVSQLWHKKDDQFWVPEGNVTLHLISPVANKTARHAVMTELYTDFLRPTLDREIYPAFAAGLRYEIAKDSGGLALRVSGYSEKLSLFLWVILDTMKSISAHPESFPLYKTAKRYGHENFEMSDPTDIGEYFCRYLVDPDVWTHKECGVELPTVTVDEYNTHCVELFSRVLIRMLVHGNFDEEESLAMMNEVESILQVEPLNPSEIPRPRTLILPDGSNYIWKGTLSNKNELNSSLTYFCHIANFEDRKTCALVALLAQIIREPFFAQLRTAEQLGYIVRSRPAVWTPSVGLLFSVEGEYDPSYVEARLETFLENMAVRLRALSEDEFRDHLTSLIEGQEKGPQNLEDERRRFAAPIKLGNTNFCIRQQYADCLRQVVLDDVITLFMARVNPGSMTRSKLSVHLRSQKLPLNDATNSLTAATIIHDARDFKSRLLSSQDSIASN